MKIATIVGARPQFIKAAPISKVIRREHKEILIHTGQHYDYELSNVFFKELNIPEPDYNLDIGSASHGIQTARMIEKIEDVLTKENPDFLIIYGDTNSTLSAVIAASKMHIPIGHVEAGLRNFDLMIPEEVNRVVADKLSSLLFAPTKMAIENLKNEGITNGVFLTGDVMYDLLLQSRSIITRQELKINGIIVEQFDYYLATIHRQENTNNIDHLREILNALSKLDKKVILPMHPRTKKIIINNSITYGDNINIIAPVGYFEFIKLLTNSKKIITDSGGAQKEAYLLKIPCITIFPSTSWIETVEDGWNKLVNASEEEIIEAVLSDFNNTKHSPHYGNGNAAEIIISKINNYFK